MDIKAIALKVAMDTGLYLDGANQSEPLYVIKPEGVVEFATALIAEVQKQNEPVAFVGEIAEGVELYLSRNDFVGRSIPLFTFPPSVEAIENKVAEACGELVLSGAHDDDPFIIAEMIANGEWRKHMKGE